MEYRLYSCLLVFQMSSIREFEPQKTPHQPALPAVYAPLRLASIRAYLTPLPDQLTF